MSEEWDGGELKQNQRRAEVSDGVPGTFNGVKFYSLQILSFMLVLVLSTLVIKVILCAVKFNGYFSIMYFCL
ncbi:MAG: hypothetical protein EG828_05595, partial [Deltaproteobacteria bacterium]|nr:hypothetical protein [Deltaproteobacteria bacterium]